MTTTEPFAATTPIPDLEGVVKEHKDFDFTTIVDGGGKKKEIDSRCEQIRKQIADITDLSVSNVGVLIHQAVTRLRSTMNAAN